MGRMKRFALAVLTYALCAGATQAAEISNWFAPLTLPAQDGFTLVLLGDQRMRLGAQNANNTLVNPFADYIAQGHPGTTTIQIALDGNGNTAVIYSGPAIPAGYQSPFQNGVPHLGLDNGTQPPEGFQVVSRNWSLGNMAGANLPSLSVNVTPAPITAARYGEVYAEAKDQITGYVVGNWFQFDFQADANPQFTFSNSSPDPFTLQNVGIFISDTAYPLDQLNFSDLPPPDQMGTRFTSLAALNGMNLAPGASITFAVPEPASLILAGIGVLGLAAWRCRRRPVAEGSNEMPRLSLP